MTNPKREYRRVRNAGQKQLEDRHTVHHEVGFWRSSSALFASIFIWPVTRTGS